MVSENTLLPGQTNAALNLQSITPFDAGNYRVVVNAACGSSVTNGAYLSVNQPALVVNSPVNVTNCSGGNATFSVAATGSGLTYQWYQGESLLFGRTNAALTIDGLTAVDAGNGRCHCAGKLRP